MTSIFSAEILLIYSQFYGFCVFLLLKIKKQKLNKKIKKQNMGGYIFVYECQRWTKPSGSVNM